MSKRVLIIAFHFPPLKLSSGLERVLAMARHLPKHGWKPIVLTAHPSAYPAVSEERLSQIPDDALIIRSRALDVKRQLSLFGRHPSWLCIPDAWQSWILSGVPAGLRLIREHSPEIIWSTYPIASAHCIGYVLHRFSGLPWMADFRDPMVEQDAVTGEWYPGIPALRRARLAIERRVAAHADAMSFCTTGAMEICMNRHAGVGGKKYHVIPNGFDESAFATAEQSAQQSQIDRSCITLLHSGTIYPTPDRDPSHFFRALRRVLDQRQGAKPVRVVLRASGVENVYSELLRELKLTQEVVFASPLPYEDALEEMLTVDGLLLLQGHTSNPAIPAKLYEYFRARRPILALTSSAGETACLLRTESVGTIVPLDDEDQIVRGLGEFLGQLESGNAPVMSVDRTSQFERGHSVARFARVFDELAEARHGPNAKSRRSVNRGG